MKKALITGIAGQDGSYLAELLLSKGYEVHGVVRRIAIEDSEHKLKNIIQMLDRIHLHVASLDNVLSLIKVVRTIEPDECYHLVKSYREQYGLFSCAGILYNHESPRRGYEFVTRKIVSSAVKIKLGLQKILALGNLDAHRDWGYAPDYVQAMWLMLQADTPDDYVVATGETHTVREFVELVFTFLGLAYPNYVQVDPQFFRPTEKVRLCGNPQKIESVLGWKGTASLSEIIAEMVTAELALHHLG